MKLISAHDRKAILTYEQIQHFRDIIWHYFNLHGRTFEWRETNDEYNIFVSEVMLQQTQTQRVIDKYRLFIERFPNFKILAEAPLRDLLISWQGLGYNRRALYLQKSAQIISNDYSGILPKTPEILITLPGIGKATAGSICAFAFNKPTVFIETNIRSVFIHHFFSGKTSIHDKEVYPLIQETLDIIRPRLWYYALMDYGVMLKKNIKNPSRKSIHYTRQSSFSGSDRQVRGKILKILTQEMMLSQDQIVSMLKENPERIERILNDLCNEGFIKNIKNFFKCNE